MTTGPNGIGGTHDIPLESVRLKRLRDGREDYELMTILRGQGQGAQVDAIVGAAYPTADSATADKDGTGPGTLLAAWAKLIDLLRGAPPPAPAAFNAVTKSQSWIRLDWTPPTVDGRTPITGYRITRSGAPAIVTGPDVRSRNITVLNAGTSYTFTLQARNDRGLGAPRTVTASTFPDGTVPGVPASLTGAAKGPDAVRLAWTPPADDGGSPLTGYQITRAGAAPITTGPDVRSRNFTGLTPDTSYTFTLQARNAVGLGAGRSVTVRTPSDALRPDALVRTNAGAFLGDDIYNTSGVDQTVQGTVSRGGSAIFAVRLQNDSGVPDDLLAADVAPASGSGVTRTWDYGATEVTQDVADGNLPFPGVPPAGNRDLRLTVSVASGAQVGTHTFYLHGYHTPVGGTPIKDVVRVQRLRHVRPDRAPEAAAIRSTRTIARGR